jgi:8-oxo-dGTP pyrophosphatase MutT (NUDIX family)
MWKGGAMSNIECITVTGQIKSIPSEQLIFRPAAYALLITGREILLLCMKATGKYHLPGGGIEIGEHMADTLRREVLEETGIPIGVGPLVDVEELFFYYDPSGRAYHGLHFYYLCDPLSGSLLSDDRVVDGSTEKPRWVPFDSLTPADFQHGGEKILAFCRAQITGSPDEAGAFIKEI